MSYVNVSTGGIDVTAEERRESCRPIAPPRLFPTGSFGLRAAVLAGMVVVAAAPVPPANTHARAPGVATTVMLAGPLSVLARGPETTCCPDRNDLLSQQGRGGGSFRYRRHAQE